MGGERDPPWMTRRRSSYVLFIILKLYYFILIAILFSTWDFNSLRHVVSILFKHVSTYIQPKQGVGYYYVSKCSIVIINY